VIAEFLQSVAERDWDGMASVFSKDIFSIDHRSGLHHRIDGAAANVEMFRMAIPFLEDLRFLPTEIVDVTDAGMIYRAVASGRTPDGFAIEAPMLTLGRVSDGLLSSFELFDHDAVETARARLRESDDPSDSAPTA
jgi:hypothetical protein